MVTAGLLSVRTRSMNVTETENGLGGTEMRNPGGIGAETMSHGGAQPSDGRSGNLTTSPGHGGTATLIIGTGGMPDHGHGGVTKLNHG